MGSGRKMNTKEIIDTVKDSPYPRTSYLVYVMNAFLQGKQIQAWNPKINEWEDIKGEPSWGWSRVEYRIK